MELPEFDEFAWFVGLFEGEGSIHAHDPKANNRKYLQLQLCSTDEDVVRRAHLIAACGTVNGPHFSHRKSSFTRKPQWIWQVASDPAYRLLMRMLPHLGERRAAKALEVCAKTGYATGVDQTEIDLANREAYDNDKELAKLGGEGWTAPSNT